MSTTQLRHKNRGKVALTDSSSISTVSTIGIIMAVAAVFEIHMDTNIVTKKRPRLSLQLSGNKRELNERLGLSVASARKRRLLPPMTAADCFDDEESYAQVEAGILDDHRDYQTTDEHHRRVVHVANARGGGVEDAHERVKADRE